MNEATQFFFDNSGSSYRPDRESEFVGRVLGANEMARAEAWARNAGALFQWCVDQLDSSEWSDERPAWDQYACLMYMRCSDCTKDLDTEHAIKDCSRKLHYHIQQSLGGVDFGHDGSPRDDNYARVVEAQLALEAMHTGALS